MRGGIYDSEFLRVGKKAYLRHGELTWQLNRDHATRAPTLDGFSELGGSRDVPEWGIRNGEIFRFVGNRWVHFAQAPKDAKIVAEGRETLFASRQEISRVKGNKLAPLGRRTPTYYYAVYVGVAVEDGTVLALTSWGQELRLSEGQTQVAFAEQDRTEAVPHGAPTKSSECAGSITLEGIGPVQKNDESENERGKERTFKWRTIFTRGNQRYAMVKDPYRFAGIERFDGTGWVPWVGPEMAEHWSLSPELMGGDPHPDSDLWLAGCGYVIDIRDRRFVRHTLPEELCPVGFLQSSTDSYFYGKAQSLSKSSILRRVGGGWASEPAPANHISGMCEREGRIYAVGALTSNSDESDTETKLLVRRAAGYFANTTSQGDWNSGLSEEEFGAFDGVSGSSTDGYLLVGDRIEHYDGKSWSEFFTDSGLGLTTIAQSQGWILGLGKDGFLYQRDSTTKGNHFLRQQHLNATSLIVESPTEATVANGKSIFHWNGQRWTAQKGPVRDASKLEIVGFARLQGKLRAYESSGQVLSLADGVWQRLSMADPITHIPGPIESQRDNDHEPHPSKLQSVSVDELPHRTFKPCVAFQPRAEVVVLLSCDSNWAATFDSGSWTSVPLPYNLNSVRYGTERKATITSGCVENGACYVFGIGSVVLKADRSAL